MLVVLKNLRHLNVVTNVMSLVTLRGRVTIFWMKFCSHPHADPFEPIVKRKSNFCKGSVRRNPVTRLKPVTSFKPVPNEDES